MSEIKIPSETGFSSAGSSRTISSVSSSLSSCFGIVVHIPLLQTSSTFPQSSLTIHSFPAKSSSFIYSFGFSPEEATSQAIPVSFHKPSKHFPDITSSPFSHFNTFFCPSVHSASLHSSSELVLHLPSIHSAFPHKGCEQSSVTEQVKSSSRHIGSSGQLFSSVPLNITFPEQLIASYCLHCVQSSLQVSSSFPSHI